jgi:hypothetical protein
MLTAVAGRTGETQAAADDPGGLLQPASTPPISAQRGLVSRRVAERTT